MEVTGNLSDEGVKRSQGDCTSTLEKRCAAHIVDSGSGFLASSFQFMIRTVVNK